MKPAVKVDKKALRNVTAIIGCASAAVALFLFLGLRLNLTPSHVPVGLWRASPVVSAEDIRPGDVITYDVREFYAAEPQMAEVRMAFEAPHIMKRVAALPGALIERSGDILSVDGKEYSRTRVAKESWRRVDYPLVVPEGTVWLMADVATAYDSRYHGPLPARLVKEKNVPLWVWGRLPGDL